ncbi:hypothetical protein [Candidatus Hodgkinia cicadicola]|uniref:hypothetical protein n=1 Tax=Candidatus Hodgkinia cicadicola TaxID=573658 RepID=UPI001788AA6D
MMGLDLWEGRVWVLAKHGTANIRLIENNRGLRWGLGLGLISWWGGCFRIGNILVGLVFVFEMLGWFWLILSGRWALGFRSLNVWGLVFWDLWWGDCWSSFVLGMLRYGDGLS